MKKQNKQGFALVSYGLTLVISLFWVALRINYSGISKFLGADTNQSFLILNLPVMVCAASWLGFLFSLLGLAHRKRGLSILGFLIGVVMTLGAAVVVCFGAWDYLRFIGVHFVRSLAAAAALTGLGWLLFCPVRPERSVRWALLLAAVAVTVVLGYNLRPCTFTYGAVVYAVEDDYQIVFSTSDSAMAWVTIDGQQYYDLYAGSARSADRVHKVTVPQTVLDRAGKYTVCAQQMIYRGPFGGYKGKTISDEYHFRPANGADGLTYAALSDVHEAVDAAAAAVRQERLDFLVLLGDLVSMVETEADAQLANKLAHEITKGQIPVIYVRGNHEIKGEYAERLYKYVGSCNQSFAYPVTLSNTVFAVVLDMGEDHEDDWWEYYGTAQFDRYRQEQTRMLESLLEEGSHQNYDYRMALCHIPIAYIDEHEYFAPFRQSWTKLLNQLEMDISLSGHEHRVWYFLPGTLTAGQPLQFQDRYPHEPGNVPGGTVTEFTFPTFLCGQRSLAQTGGTQKWGKTDYLCLTTEADLEAGTQTHRYSNSQGEAVTMEYPFVTEAEVAVSWKELTTQLP